MCRIINPGEICLAVSVKITDDQRIEGSRDLMPSARIAEIHRIPGCVIRAIYSCNVCDAITVKVSSDDRR